MMLVSLWISHALAGSVHADQARIFLKRRYFDEALAEVNAGLADPNTGDALELYAIGVDAAWEIGDIDRVLVWSQQAADLALNDDAHAGWQARHDAVAASWGWVDLNRAKAPKHIAIEPAAPVFDPEQKRIAAALLLRLQGQAALPERIPLPVGEWRVDGARSKATKAQLTSLVRVLRLFGDGRIRGLGEPLPAPVGEGSAAAYIASCVPEPSGPGDGAPGIDGPPAPAPGPPRSPRGRSPPGGDPPAPADALRLHTYVLLESPNIISATPLLAAGWKFTLDSGGRGYEWHPPFSHIPHGLNAANCRYRCCCFCCTFPALHGISF